MQKKGNFDLTWNMEHTMLIYLFNYKFKSLKISRVVVSCVILLLLLFTLPKTPQARMHTATYQMDTEITTLFVKPEPTEPTLDDLGLILEQDSDTSILELFEEPEEAIVSVNRVPSTSSCQIHTRNGSFSSTDLSNDLKKMIEKCMASIPELNFKSSSNKDEVFDRLPSSNPDVLNLNSPIPDFWHLF
jgi:hypothetical protein